MFSCSTQMGLKLIKLINVKMPTIVGIFTLMSRINTTCVYLKQENVVVFQFFIFWKRMKFYAQRRCACKKFSNLWFLSY